MYSGADVDCMIIPTAYFRNGKGKIRLVCEDCARKTWSGPVSRKTEELTQSVLEELVCQEVMDS
jgi:hypothetical protein